MLPSKSVNCIVLTQGVWASMVAILNGNLASSKFIANKLGVDKSLLQIILSCGAKKLKYIKENADVLTKKLGLSSSKAVVDICRVICGDFSVVEEMTKLSTKKFQIVNFKTIKALLHITYIGNKISKGSSINT